MMDDSVADISSVFSFNLTITFPLIIYYAASINF